jgi:hypothetical protein
VLSLTRGWVCNLKCSQSLVQVTQNPNTYLTFSFETAQLCPWAFGSLSVTSHNSQGLWWRYSSPPPHGDTSNHQSQSYVDQSVPVSDHDLKPAANSSFPSNSVALSPQANYTDWATTSFPSRKLSKDICLFYYEVLSLTREWVCNLQLLLDLTSAVFLRPVLWDSRRYYTLSTSREKSKSKLPYSCRPVSWQVCLGIRTPSGIRDQFFFFHTHGICLQTAVVLFSLLWGVTSEEW